MKEGGGGLVKHTYTSPSARPLEFSIKVAEALFNAVRASKRRKKQACARLPERAAHDFPYDTNIRMPLPRWPLRGQVFPWDFSHRIYIVFHVPRCSTRGTVKNTSVPLKLRENKKSTAGTTKITTVKAGLHMAADGRHHPGAIRWYPPGTADDEIRSQRRCRCQSDIGVWWCNHNDDDGCCDSRASCCSSCTSSCSSSYSFYISSDDNNVDCYCCISRNPSHRRPDRRPDRPVIVQCDFETTAAAAAPAPVRRRRRQPSCLERLFLPRRAPQNRNWNQHQNHECRAVQVLQQERGRTFESGRGTTACRGCERRRTRGSSSILVRWRTYIFGTPRMYYQHRCSCER